MCVCVFVCLDRQNLQLAYFLISLIANGGMCIMYVRYITPHSTLTLLVWPCFTDSEIRRHVMYCGPQTPLTLPKDWNIFSHVAGLKNILYPNLYALIHCS